jgi:pyruvate formate lyase activating enzyme
MELTTYGKISALAMDPIEKKPLNHFLPGSSVLSFGTAGCNLFCKHCQNSSLSRAREQLPQARSFEPEELADLAVSSGAKSMAYTYNDPVIFCEYAVDTAKACEKLGIRRVAVTAGYINAEARKYFFSGMDAVNLDLKSIRPGFYAEICSGSLEPVLETLLFLGNHTGLWLEITNLLIPGLNDSEQEIRELCHWLVSELGPDVPLHFTAFHPSFKLAHLPRTPDSTLTMARAIGADEGVRFIYLGNCRIPGGSDTRCPRCKEVLIRRKGYAVEVNQFDLKLGTCGHCGTVIPGRWSDS